MQEQFDFSEALRRLRDGKRVGRREWVNARYVYFVPGSSFEVNKGPLTKFFPKGKSVAFNSHIDMCNSNEILGTWAPQMVDVLAQDWYELETDPAIAETHVEVTAPVEETPAVEAPEAETTPNQEAPVPEPAPTPAM